jgi:hypothetical protein
MDVFLNKPKHTSCSDSSLRWFSLINTAFCYFGWIGNTADYIHYCSSSFPGL